MVSKAPGHVANNGNGNGNGKTNHRTNDILSNPLGKQTKYQEGYQANLLFPITRFEKRKDLGMQADLPFHGEDIWNAYELSWLNSNGLPQVAIAEFRFPADSPNIIESKSFKLYLNSLTQSHFESANQLKNVLQKDLTAAVDANVFVLIQSLSGIKTRLATSFDAICIDHQAIQINQYDYSPNSLRLKAVESPPPNLINENLCSHLLKSNCLITNQPDWASIFIHYQGAAICHQSLLKYLVSFRKHNEFHEQCVERIFVDLMTHCQPKKLTVYARYTRRGGLDINPWRSNEKNSMENIRLVRQ